jgi:hypothetical protein
MKLELLDQRELKMSKERFSLFLRKVSKRIQRMRGKYLSVYGEHDKLGLFAIHEIVFEYAESI